MHLFPSGKPVVLTFSWSGRWWNNFFLLIRVQTANHLTSETPRAGSHHGEGGTASSVSNYKCECSAALQLLRILVIITLCTHLCDRAHIHIVSFLGLTNDRSRGFNLLERPRGSVPCFNKQGKFSASYYLINLIPLLNKQPLTSHAVLLNLRNEGRMWLSSTRMGWSDLLKWSELTTTQRALKHPSPLRLNNIEASSPLDP